MKAKFIKEVLKESLNEDNIDKVRERRFGILDKEEEKQYNSEFRKDEIVFSSYDWKLIKNPINLKDIESDIRAVVTKNGDLYIENMKYRIHSHILDIMKDCNIIKKVSDKWHEELPKEFLTIQRWKESKVFLIGESNMILSDEIGNKWREGLEFPSEKIIKIYDDFLKAARLENPQYKFLTRIH